MSDKLKKTIDRMVEDSIRRILPEVMNEVLLRTITNSGVVSETRRPAPRQVQRPAKRASSNRPQSLDQLLAEAPEAGVDFYQDPRQAMASRLEDDAPRRNLAISSLPPEIRAMTEGIEIDDDVGEMWDEAVSPLPQATSAEKEGPPLDMAARAIGLNFSRMSEAVRATEKNVKRPDQSFAIFEENRLKRMRERLNDGKPVE